MNESQTVTLRVPRQLVQAWPNLLLFAISLSLSVWQLSSHLAVSQYDSSLYFGSALELVTGHLPYRDFVFIQPPGISILLAPFAFVAVHFSTALGIALARLACAAIVGSVPVLVALLTRRYGFLVSWLCGLTVAVTPVASLMLTAIKVDPTCLAASLWGAWLLLEKPAPQTSHRDSRAVLAGALLGFAFTVKFWAAFPLLGVVATLAVSREWRRLRVFLTSTVSSAVIICLPFFVTAPSKFVNQVLFAQLARSSSPLNNSGAIFRLQEMTGLSSTPLLPSANTIKLLYFAFALLVGVAYLLDQRTRPVDVFLLSSSIVTVVAILIAPQTFTYYGFFAVALLYPLLITSCVRIFRVGRTVIGNHQLNSSATSRWITVAVILASLVLVPVTARNVVAVTQEFGLPDTAPGIAERIPAGSCVLYDYAALGVVSGRLVSTDRECPIVLALGDIWFSMKTAANVLAPENVRMWNSFMASASYVVFGRLRYDSVPWTSENRDYFNRTFRLMYVGPNYRIFERR